jgi:ABC-type transport system involved in cytochrome c biogenesis permease subunit
MTGVVGLVDWVVWLCALSYAASWLFLVLGRRASASVCLWSGWIGNVLLFAINWALAGEPPFGNMYHVHVFLALCIPVLHAAWSRRSGPGWSAVYFAFAAAVVMVGAAFMGRDVHWRRMPALQSPWFVPHVFAYMLSYALAMLAFAMTVSKWLRRDAEVRAAHRDAARQLIRMGFPLMTFGMLSGALWAEEAWGAYWSWDPKETWSLITWVGYVAYLHGAFGPRARREAWEDTTQTLAFVSLLWTFLLVNLVPRLASILHGYAR